MTNKTRIRSETISTHATPHHLARALLPLTSLITKSQKALHKLPKGTWQHTMLQNNLNALRLATALLQPNLTRPRTFTRPQLKKSLVALTTMISKTRKPTFPKGSPQHTLQRNRLKSLRLAATAIRAKLETQSR